MKGSLKNKLCRVYLVGLANDNLNSEKKLPLSTYTQFLTVVLVLYRLLDQITPAYACSVTSDQGRPIIM